MESLEDSTGITKDSEGKMVALPPSKPISVSVQDFSLSLLKKGMFSKEVKEVHLLRNISTQIQGGQLVAIMGGSGTNFNPVFCVDCIVFSID